MWQNNIFHRRLAHRDVLVAGLCSQLSALILRRERTVDVRRIAVPVFIHHVAHANRDVPAVIPYRTVEIVIFVFFCQVRITCALQHCFQRRGNADHFSVLIYRVALVGRQTQLLDIRADQRQNQRRVIVKDIQFSRAAVACVVNPARYVIRINQPLIVAFVIFQRRRGQQRVGLTCFQAYADHRIGVSLTAIELAQIYRPAVQVAQQVQVFTQTAPRTRRKRVVAKSQNVRAGLIRIEGSDLSACINRCQTTVVCIVVCSQYKCVNTRLFYPEFVQIIVTVVAQQIQRRETGRARRAEAGLYRRIKYRVGRSNIQISFDRVDAR